MKNFDEIMQRIDTTMAECCALIKNKKARLAALEKDREALAAMVACLVEDLGGKVFISADRFNRALRNRLMVFEENEDLYGIFIYTATDESHNKNLHEVP